MRSVVCAGGFPAAQRRHAMTDLEKMARELLAAEYKKEPYGRTLAALLNNGKEEVWLSEVPAIRAIRTALLTAPPGFKLVPSDHPDVYQVRTDGEWGTFVLRHGQRQDARGTAYWCELIAATSFGTVSHHWSSMGQPAAKFLPRLERDYALGKLWGSGDRVFDADATLRYIKQEITKQRRAGEIDAEEARERWDNLPEYLDNEHELAQLADDCDWLWQGLSEGDYVQQKINPQAEGFWRYLWPRFLEQLAVTPEVK